MEKRLTLMFILAVQPIFAGLIWFSMNTLMEKLGLKGAGKIAAALACAVALWLIFTFFFAQGFLSSNEAKNLGF